MMWSDASTISSRCWSASRGSRPSVSVCAQVAHLRLFRRRHAEHLGDHPERQREREVGDHVHLGPVSWPRATAASSISSTIACTRGASCSTVRGVNTCCTSRRRRVWSGGSRLRIPRVPRWGRSPEDLLADLGPRVGPDHAAVLDAQAGVAQQPDGVVVAEERPQAERACAAPGWWRRARRTAGTGPRRSPARRD